MSYLYLGGAFLMACLIAGLLWFRAEAANARAEAQQARADLAVAIDANHAQEAAIGRLRAQAEADAKTITAFADDVDAIRAAQEAAAGELGALKDANETVRDYLSTAVPADLKRLLDR